MLITEAFFGYKHLILGACGCGAYANDASMISDLFHKSLNELDYNRLKEKVLFRRIDFVVIDRAPTQFNYKQFKRNFAGCRVEILVIKHRTTCLAVRIVSAASSTTNWNAIIPDTVIVIK